MPEPTYDEGYVRGQREEADHAEHARLADIFDRDRGHLATLYTMTTTIRRSLGNIAASLDEHDDARHTADALANALGRAEVAAEQHRDLHREKARR